MMFTISMEFIRNCKIKPCVIRYIITNLIGNCNFYTSFADFFQCNEFFAAILQFEIIKLTAVLCQEIKYIFFLSYCIVITHPIFFFDLIICKEAYIYIIKISDNINCIFFTICICINKLRITPAYKFKFDQIWLFWISCGCDSKYIFIGRFQIF